MKVRSRARLALAAAGAAATIAIAAASSLADTPGDASRYPYDPVCSWGRIANGKGMLVRCLTQQEAERLLSRADAGAPPPPTPSASAADAGRAAPAAKPEDEDIDVRVGPVVVEEGTLPKAEKKLGVPKDKYAACVKEHGGLAGTSGEVQVRFLVRSRGRAEGVSVAKRQGVSPNAAHCVAAVVDRRYVGVPEAPLVGAKVIVKFSRHKP